MKINSLTNFLLRAVIKIQTVINDFFIRIKYLFFNQSAFKRTEIPALSLFLDSNFESISDKELKANLESILDFYKVHRFDLLGSGWVDVGYDVHVLGLEGIKFDTIEPKQSKTIQARVNDNLRKSHRSHSLDVLNLINKEEYQLIDWQKDYKSGFHWSAKSWHKDCLKKATNKRGADIKLPWELSRLQHLPQMAMIALISPSQRNFIISEYRNIVLDFIAMNPVGMGVNWACNMDVAIRISNLLIAYDLLKPLDKDDILDDDFHFVINHSIYQHGCHIVNNFEWSPNYTSNHYLANIAGLIFVSVYLESTNEIDNWLAFGIQELIYLVKTQFNPDGSNFEGSTSYHRLSAEMIIYCVAVILGLSNEKKIGLKTYNNSSWKGIQKLNHNSAQQWDLNTSNFFPDWFVERLYFMGKFTVDLVKQNGDVPQFGDNDNGRFFRFTPSGEMLSALSAEEKYINLSGYSKLTYTKDKENYWDENHLNHTTLIAAFHGLFSNEVFQLRKYYFETDLIRSLAKNISLSYKPKAAKYSYFKVETDIPDFEHQNCVSFTEANNLDLLEDLEVIRYPDFGIYIYKSNFLYLAVSNLSIGQGGKAGHNHDDNASFELQIDGKDLVKDPGTYIYTALPEKREIFRSNAAHHNINIPASSSTSKKVFEFDINSSCLVIEFDAKSIILKRRSGIYINVRKFTLSKNEVRIEDTCNFKFENKINSFEYYSNGYGKLTRM